MQAGDTILFHAAAGGVGLIAAQWCRAIGVNMIGTVGSDDNTQVRLSMAANAARHQLQQRELRRKGQGNHGRQKVPWCTTASAGHLAGVARLPKPLGLMVSFGNSSGPVTGVDLGIRRQRARSTSPGKTLMAPTSSRATTEEMANNVFNMIEDSKIDLAARQTYSLADAARKRIATWKRGRRWWGYLVP